MKYDNIIGPEGTNKQVNEITEAWDVLSRDKKNWISETRQQLNLLEIKLKANKVWELKFWNIKSDTFATPDLFQINLYN